MNPLTFFPPPSRSLSRVNSRPSSANNNSGSGTGLSGAGSGVGGGTNSSSSSTKSVRRTLQPLSTTSSRVGSSSKIQTLSSNNNNNTNTIGPSGGASGEIHSSSSSASASGATTPERSTGDVVNGATRHRQLSIKRPVTSPSSPSISSEMLSPRLKAVAGDGYSSDSDVKSGTVNVTRNGSQSGTSSPRRHERMSSSQQLKRQLTNSSTNTTHTQSTGGRLGHRLPAGLYFDYVRANEIGHAHRIETQSYDQDDAATLELLRYRQKAAPHLFLGAFIPLPLPKVSGPLSMSGPQPRKLIAFASGSASSALTARAMKIHSDDEFAWLVCLWSVCVASEYRRKGLGSKLIEEYIRRLRRAEEGEKKKGYECVALITHEESIPLFEKAAFKKLGVSHVNVGSGGWFELRRYISPRDHDDEEDDNNSNGSGSDKNDIRSPLQLSGFLSSEGHAHVPTDLAEKGEEVATTPTQELERRLEAHVATLPTTEDEVKGLPIKSPNLFISDSEGSQEAVELSKSPAEISPDMITFSTSKNEKTASSVKDGEALSGISPSGQPSAFSSAKIMEALSKQQASTKNAEGPRNPGIAYSTIMGQTLASKTSVEDAFFALEARLVNREDLSNLGDLYCPREECSCLLLKGGNADWEIAEMGPLTQSNLSLPNSPAPPSAPMPPPPAASLDRIRSALGGTQRDPSVTSTAAHAFWIVHSPLIFENIGFSRDTEWRLPPVPKQSKSSSLGSDGDSSNNGESSADKKKTPKRGNSFFRGIRETIDKSKERKLTGGSNSTSSSTINQLGKGSKSSKSLSPTSMLANLTSSNETEGSEEGGGNSDTKSVTAAAAGPTKVKVKYLLCADCDCGPLGYTVLPASMEGGNFANEVGKQAANQFNEQNEQQPSSNQPSPPSRPKPEPQLYFIAADRVRYRLPK